MIDSHLCPQSNVTVTSTIATLTSKTSKEALNIEESHVKYGTLDPFARMPLTHDAVTTPEPAVAPIKYLIFDCSALSYVDLSGTKVVTSLHNDLQKKEIILIFANCSEPLMKQLDRCNFFKSFPKSQVYPSIMDAVLTIQNFDSSAAVNSLTSQLPPSDFPVSSKT